MKNAIPDIRNLQGAERAIADYARHGAIKKFRKQLRDHFLHGYVFSAPHFFMMCKAVDLGEDCGPAWYVTYANGDPRILLALIPFPLPCFAWRRYRHGREELRVYDFERVARLVSQSRPPLP
jgi:hypothetical protein